MEKVWEELKKIEAQAEQILSEAQDNTKTKARAAAFNLYLFFTIRYLNSSPSKIGKGAELWWTQKTILSLLTTC